MSCNGELHFWYRNHRSEETLRRVRFTGIRYGVSRYYLEPQWLLIGFDSDKGAEREFSIARMKPTTLAQVEAEDAARALRDKGAGQVF